MDKKSKYLIPVLTLGLLFLFFIYLLYKHQTSIVKNSKANPTNLGTWNPNVFYDPVKTSHFLSSDPKHGQTFKTLPKTVTLTFDAPLQQGSYFKAEVWDENYIKGGEGGVSFSGDRKTMTGKLENAAITGMYEVMYTVCFANEQCQDGSFRFLVDPTKK